MLVTTKPHQYLMIIFKGISVVYAYDDVLCVIIASGICILKSVDALLQLSTSPRISSKGSAESQVIG